MMGHSCVQCVESQLNGRINNGSDKILIELLEKSRNGCGRDFPNRDRGQSNHACTIESCVVAL